MFTAARRSVFVLAAFFFTVNAPLTTAIGQGTMFTYQGRLLDSGLPANGSYDLSFTVFDAASNGSIHGNVTNDGVAVSNGLFTVMLDFGNQFPGADRWLEIAARTNGTGTFITLSPRQKLTPAPYATTAGGVTDGNIARLNVPNSAVTATGHPVVSGGLVTGAIVDNGGSGYAAVPGVMVNDSTGSGASVSATLSNGAVIGLGVNSPGSNYSADATLSIGSPPPNNFQVFVTSNYFPNVNLFSNPQNSFAGAFTGNGASLTNLQAWQLGGNSGTTPAANFIGTLDNQAFEFRANGVRTLRIEPAGASAASSHGVLTGAPNIIGGSAINFADSGVVGAVIGGGGATNYDGGIQTNSVAADFGTIGGGFGNTIQINSQRTTIGGGDYNMIQPGADWATIAGGHHNTIGTNSASSMIGGGDFNSVGNNSGASTIAGGSVNTIFPGASSSSVGGGLDNTNTGMFATVPGGFQNLATNYAFAAGQRAKAIHPGAFVWADTQSADFASTANDQFNVRAQGGVVLAANVAIGTGSGDYRHLQIGGGNSTGFLYGSYAALGDGIHLGYNFYYDAAGTPHVYNDGGATSRLTTGYGFIDMAIGAVNTAPSTVMLHVTSAGVCVNGTVSNCSDRNVKQDFAPVEASEVLDKVLQLPVTEWSYKMDASTRHIGPMAQDFYGAFNVGPDDKHITTVDESGVALAAIQGLNEKLEARSKSLESENTELKRQNESLEKRLAALEQIVGEKARPDEAPSW